MARRQGTIDVTTEKALYTWAGQKRQAYANIQWWQPDSVIGKLMDEGPGVRRGGKVPQRWDELYIGDGLIVQRIVSKMSGPPRLVLTCYYLLGGRASVREQCRAIGITRAQYWPGLHAGEEAVSVGLQLLEEYASPGMGHLKRLIKGATTP